MLTYIRFWESLSVSVYKIRAFTDVCDELMGIHKQVKYTFAKLNKLFENDVVTDTLYNLYKECIIYQPFVKKDEKSRVLVSLQESFKAKVIKSDRIRLVWATVLCYPSGMLSL